MFPQKYRAKKMVRQDLTKRGIKPDFLSVRRLRLYSPVQYRTLFGLIDRAKLLGQFFSYIAVDKMRFFPFVRPDDVPQEILEGCLLNGVLDIKGLRQKLQDQANLNLVASSVPALEPKLLEEQLPQTMPSQMQIPFVGDLEGHARAAELIDVIAEERQQFRTLAAKPNVTINKIFKALDHGKEKLGFLNVVVYRPVPDGSGRWIRTQRTRDWSGGTSKYDFERGGHEPDTTLRSVIQGDKVIYDVDIIDLASFTAAGLVPDRLSIEKDLANSKGPGRMLFIKLANTEGQALAVVQIHNRVGINENIRPEALLPVSKAGAKRIKTELELYFDEVVSAIEKVRDKDREDAGLRLAAVPPDFDLFSFISQRTISRIYLGYEVGSIDNPSKLPPGLINGVVTSLDWMKRGCEDMLEHVVNVDETRVAFFKGQPVAFASINELPYVYPTKRGSKAGSVIPLVGTAVRQAHRRQGLQVLLNFELIVKRWLRLKFSGGLFKPLRIATRTKSPIVIQALYTHFRDVKYEELNPEEHIARKTYAQHLGCTVNDNGIVNNAYDQPLPEKIDQQRLSARLRKQVDAAMHGLGPRDARIFVFKYGAWEIIKTSLWLLFKRLRSR